jgi:hypothetical protein
VRDLCRELGVSAHVYNKAARLYRVIRRLERRAKKH